MLFIPMVAVAVFIFYPRDDGSCMRVKYPCGLFVFGPFRRESETQHHFLLRMYVWSVHSNLRGSSFFSHAPRVVKSELCRGKERATKQ